MTTGYHGVTLVTVSRSYPHVIAFRMKDEEVSIINDIVDTYPGRTRGAALREFFTSPEVMTLVTNLARARSDAFRRREARLVDAALRDLLGEDDEPSPTPSDPHPPQHP